MQTTFALAALAAVAYAAPQGVTQSISPSSSAPAGCSPSYNGQFEVTIINGTTTKRRDLNKVFSSFHHFMICIDFVSVNPHVDNQATSPSPSPAAPCSMLKAEPATLQQTTNSNSTSPRRLEPSTPVASPSAVTDLSHSEAQMCSMSA